MKLSLLLLLSATISSTTAYWKGFNIKSNGQDGTSCKTTAEYAKDFALMKTFPNKINSARLYSSSLCNTLLRAVPAAVASDTKILVGIQPNSSVYDAEKGALINAIAANGWKWLAAVAVGNEDLYRGEISAAELAAKIYDVRGMIKKLPNYQFTEVGHVDTTNAWTNAANYQVTRACDFIGTDIYPYFQKTQFNDISNASALFYSGLQSVRNAVVKAGSKANVWVTETGWPINGPTLGDGVPGIANAQTYWNKIFCTAIESVNLFWFTLQDWEAVPSFGVINDTNQQYYSQAC